MKLHSLLNAGEGIPLSHIEGVKDESFIGSSLYRLENGIYLFLSKFNISKKNEDSIGPFVTGVLFAADDGAAKRVSMAMIEADSGNPFQPPDALELGFSDFRYESILLNLKNTHPKVCRESSSYRVATDGKFIHRKIETEKYTFYFRELLEDSVEPPYAILKKL